MRGKRETGFCRVESVLDDQNLAVPVVPALSESQQSANAESFHKQEDLSYCEQEPLDYPAERALRNAPIALLNNGFSQVPQQFYEFDHSLDSVELLLKEITFSDQFPVFTGEDESGVYIQVGIIGHENYGCSTLIKEKKIVYGRKWRGESNLPTSEVIQTVFLALKKAREHEIREMLTLSHPDLKGQPRVSTPFNNHHDLPLMLHADLTVAQNDRLTEQQLRQFLSRLSFGQRTINLQALERRRNGQILCDIQLGSVPELIQRENAFPEYDQREITLLLPESSINACLFALMDELLSISDRYVEEHFKYRGFARFSRSHSIEKIGAFSVETRYFSQDQICPHFDQTFQTMCGEVDQSRVPGLNTSAQKRRLKSMLEQSDIKEGFLPHGVEPYV